MAADLCGAFGGLPLDEHVRVATPWGAAPSGALGVANCGGGCFVSSTSVVVWRGADRRLWLAEACLRDGFGNGIVLDLASPLRGDAVGVFVSGDRLAVCVASEQHVTLFEGTASFLGRAALEGRTAGRCVALASLCPLALTSAVWASESIAFFGCVDGTVARVDAGRGKYRIAGEVEAGLGRRLLNRALLRSPSAAPERKVVAVACCAVVVALRADASLAGWDAHSLAVVLSLRLGDELDAYSGSRLAIVCEQGVLRVGAASRDRAVVVEQPLGDAPRVVASLKLGGKATTAAAFIGDTLWTAGGSVASYTIGGRALLHTSRTASDDDEELVRRAKRAGGWTSYFDNDWSRATATIERFFLGRLGHVRRFSDRALSDALRYSLPAVVKGPEPAATGADAALSACRAWYKLVARDLRDDAFDDKCDALVGCWRELLDLVKAQADVEAEPLGFVVPPVEGGHPGLVQAAHFSLVMPYGVDNEDDDDDLCRLGAARRALVAGVKRNDDAQDLLNEWRLRVDDLVAASLRAPGRNDDYELQVSSGAKDLAATAIDAALGCAEALAEDDDPDENLASIEDPVALQREIRARHVRAALRFVRGRGRTSAVPSVRLAAAVDCAAAHARHAYERARDGLMAVAVAEAVAAPTSQTRDLVAALASTARSLALAAWVCSTAAAPIVPGLTSAVETTEKSRELPMDGRSLAWAVAIGDELPLPPRFAAARAALRVAECETLGAPLVALQAGARLDDASCATAHSSSLVDVTAASSGDLLRAERAWYGAATRAATLVDNDGLVTRVARVAFFGEDTNVARRVARVLLDDDDESGEAHADLEARLFEANLTDDLEAAFAATTTQAIFAGKHEPPEERLGRLVRVACDTGQLDRLLNLPWSPAEFQSLDMCLERLARRGGPTIFDTGAVDYPLYLYAARLGRGAYDEAARAMLELASRLDRDPPSLESKAAAIGARLAALNALHLLPERDAFVAARPPALGNEAAATRLHLTSRIDLDLALADTTATFALLRAADAHELAALGSKPPVGRLALALARADRHQTALDLVRAQPPTNQTPEAFTLVFANLAARCVDLDTDDVHRDYPLAQLDVSPFVVATKFLGSSSRPRFGPRARPVWTRLYRLLDACDSPDVNFACAKAAAHAVLAKGADLPLALEQRFYGDGPDFAGGRADPAALLRLYLTFGKLDDAARFLADLLRRIPPDTQKPTCLPFALIDDLLLQLNSREDVGEQPHAALIELLDRYLTDLAHASRRTLADRILATLPR